MVFQPQRSLHPAQIQQEPPAPLAAPHSLADIEIALLRPLVTHAGDLRKLTLRVPTFGDFVDLGEVTRMFAVPSETDPEQMGQVELKVDRAAVMRWASRLSGHDRVVLGQLAPADAQKLMSAIVQVVGLFTKAGSGGN